MNKIGLIITGAFFLFSQSCVKDKLKDDKSELIGKWNWIYTDYTTGLCTNSISTTVLTPTTENVTYSLELLEKGKVKIYKDGKIINRGRIAFSYWEPESVTSSGMVYNDISNTGEYFIILLNNKTKNRIEGSIKNDTIRLQRSFFFENLADCYNAADSTSCCSNDGYYVRG